MYDSGGVKMDVILLEMEHCIMFYNSWDVSGAMGSV